MLLTNFESTMVNQVIDGCNKIVNEEEAVYRSRLKMKSTINHLRFLSLTDMLVSGETTGSFRPIDLEGKLQDGLKSSNYYRDINRILRWQISKGMLIKDVVTPAMRQNPGRHKKQDDRQEPPGVQSYYCTSGYLDFLRKFVCTFIPRSIIFVKLQNANVLNRILTVLEFNRLSLRRNMSIQDVKKGHAKMQPVIESTFDESKFLQDQRTLLQKNKRELLQLAEKRAAYLFQQLTWRATLYTRFFIYGGLSYHELPS